MRLRKRVKQLEKEVLMLQSHAVDNFFLRQRDKKMAYKSRENLMLLMEYLGLYIDKRVIKKDKKK